MGLKLLKISVCALVAFVVVSRTASAAEPDVGTAVAVVNNVTLETERSKQALVKGETVHQQEAIETAEQSEADVELLDRTKLAIGPASKVVLDKFLVDPNAKKSVAIRMSEGAFRFVTGTLPKASYEVKTPSAIIGVRGTIFDVYVAANGDTAVLLHEGSIIVCNLARRCRNLGTPGSIIVVTVAGEVFRYSTCADSFLRRIGFDAAFPFLTKPPFIDAVTRAAQTEFDCSPRPQLLRTRVEDPQPGTGPAVSPVQQDRFGFFAGTTAQWARTAPIKVKTTTVFPYNSFLPQTVSASGSGNGPIAGGEAGFDWQSGWFVYGLSAGIQAGGINGSTSSSSNALFGQSSSYVNSRLDWLGTLRARAGILVGDVLFFGSGGVVIGGVEDNSSLFCCFNTNEQAQRYQTRVGYAGGGGIEYLFGPSLSVKVEYTYANLGTSIVRVAGQINDGEGGIQTVTSTTRFNHDYDAFRGTIQYRFAPGDQPLN